MGYLSYEGRVKMEIDDRPLAHLQVVISDKLRRGEPVTFTWYAEPSVGGGRTTIWINQSSSLVFKYQGSRPPSINRAWLQLLAEAANAVGGLRLVQEPADVASESVG
ncbi:DUF7882 family protein [Microbacterium terrisoli]|jgi:hypothetical protein|uniref:DUF7882 family protein n=1 Tax=Microbacterium terrisoli TaxID=3242192 RepID=UPI003F88B453